VPHNSQSAFCFMILTATITVMLLENKQPPYRLFIAYLAGIKVFWVINKE